MITYKLFTDPFNKNISRVIKFDGNTTVNFSIDENNPDYQAFLRWCEEGNTPEQADNV